MEFATGQPSPVKRARIDDSDNVEPGTSPMESSTKFLDRYCSESLPLTIAPLFCQTAKTYLITLVKIFHKKNQTLKFQDDQDYIPRSVKINFTLNGLDETMKCQQFLDLQSETSTLITAFQKEIKNKIEEVIKMDTLTLQSTCQSILAKQLHLMSNTHLTLNESNANVHQVVSTLLTRHGLTLLEPLDTTIQDFKTLYKTTHGLTTLPNPEGQAQPRSNLRMTTVSATASRHFASSTPNETTAVITTTEDPVVPTADSIDYRRLYTLFENLFVIPWKTYKSQFKSNQMSLKLKKIVESSATTDATVAASMELDTEPSLEPKKIMELIRSETLKNTKQISKQLESLKITVDNMPKNSIRGGQRSHPKLNKKTPQKTKTERKTVNTKAPKKQSHRPVNTNQRKADDAHNDSGRKSKSSFSKKSKGQSHKKKPNLKQTRKPKPSASTK